MRHQKYKNENTETIYWNNTQKKQISKRKQQPFRNRKRDTELRDTELKDREIRIRKEIAELFF